MFLNSLVRSLNVNTKSIIQSYRSLRRLIGLLGIALPYVCILGGLFIADTAVQTSISVYYYTNMRDFFVGMMFIISIFLITYKGYKKIDFVITFITGLAGLGTGIFPCFNLMFSIEPVGIFQLSPTTSNIFHNIFAASFIFLLAINSMFLFTKTDTKRPEKSKITRNRIYIGCGILIILCLIGIAISLYFLPKEFVRHYRIIMIFETAALNAFGFSWLVKGHTLFRDKK